MIKITKDINTLVFDWDGTIFNSMKYKKLNIIKSLQNFTNIESKKIIELHKKYSGIPRRHLIEKIYFESQGIILEDETYNKISKFYTKMNIESSKNATIFPDALRLIQKIKKINKIKIYISSSASREEIEYSAKKNEIACYFIELLGSENEFTKGKTHFDYILKKENIGKENLVFIGDDYHDYLIGKQNNITTYQVCRGNSRLDDNFKIGSMDDIELYI